MVGLNNIIGRPLAARQLLLSIQILQYEVLILLRVDIILVLDKVLGKSLIQEHEILFLNFLEYKKLTFLVIQTIKGK